MNLKTILLAATTLALPLAAQAQPVTGLYVGAGVGANFKQDQNGNANLNVPQTGDTIVIGRTSGKLSSDPGFAALGSVGWGFGNGLRMEIEGNYRNNGADRARTSFGSFGLGGKTETYGVMGNALFDMNVGLPWMYPYIGGGAGYAWTHADDIRRSCCAAPSITGTSGNFAYQAIAGAAFPIAAMPGLSITGEYRFMGVMGDTKNTLAGFSSPAPRVKLDDQYNHSLMLGVRYAFNAAPAAVMAAAPMPAAVAPASKSFLVFFDWDKATLTDRARGIIQDAAQSSKSVSHTVVEVNGYADTSGNPGYNQGLSMRRAQTVAAELVRNGVTKQEIAIKAFGDTVLLVPTGPGVREPQNRRVEIIIR